MHGENKDKKFYITGENFDELQLPYSSMFFAETSHILHIYLCIHIYVHLSVKCY